MCKLLHDHVKPWVTFPPAECRSKARHCPTCPRRNPEPHKNRIRNYMNYFFNAGSEIPKKTREKECVRVKTNARRSDGMANSVHKKPNPLDTSDRNAADHRYAPFLYERTAFPYGTEKWSPCCNLVSAFEWCGPIVAMLCSE